MESFTVKSKYIALIFNEETKELIMVINADNDMDLHDPAYMIGPEKRKKILIPRYMSPMFDIQKMTASGVSYIQQNSEKFFNGEY